MSLKGERLILVVFMVGTRVRVRVGGAALRYEPRFFLLVSVKAADFEKDDVSRSTNVFINRIGARQRLTIFV